MNAAKNMYVDFINQTIVITKAFSKKASVFGCEEFKTLRSAQMECPNFRIVVKEANDKKTYNGLGFDRMEDYIKTQPNSEQRLKEFEDVKRIAEAKGAAYPLTKKWFFETYPEYKKSDIIFAENSGDASALKSEGAEQNYKTVSLEKVA